MTHYQYATTYITPNSAQWWQTHCKGTSHPVWQMLLTLCRIADNHKARYASNIGDDGVLGDHWEQMVQGLRGMLNGDCGTLDCGTVDHILCHMLEIEGFEA